MKTQQTPKLPDITSDMSLEDLSGLSPSEVALALHNSAVARRDLEQVESSIASPPQAHSSLPWSHYNSDNGRIFKTWSVQDSSGNKVCSLPETSTEANAAFIVRACNKYDELRAKYTKLWEQRHDARAHAQRLADALRDFDFSFEELAKDNYQDALMRFVGAKRRSRVALAQWEKQ